MKASNKETWSKISVCIFFILVGAYLLVLAIDALNQCVIPRDVDADVLFLFRALFVGFPSILMILCTGTMVQLVKELN